MKNQLKVICQMNLIMLFLVFGMACPAYASCRVHTFTDAQDTADAVQEDWEDDYFEEMTIQEDSNQVEVDGEQDKFTEVFSVSSGTMREAVSSEDHLEDFLDDQQEKKGEIYEVEEKEDGVYSVTAPYQTRRIVIYSTDVTNNYGAQEKYIYEDGHETILSFDTELATQEAYEKIKARYGEDNCYVDTVFSTADQAYSWGAATTGMDTLKTSASSQTNLSTVKVAVIDTGIDTSSTIFQGKTILSNSYNFLNGNKNLKDSCGHGTHVAGIIADLTPSNVQFLILKISEDGTSSNLVMSLALDYAVSKNVDVINLSFGFISQESVSYTFLDSAINRAYKKGIPVCTAAGNQTDENGMSSKNLDVKYCYPANNDQTIAVSALNADLTLASYSYRSTKSQMKIDFAAPGTDIKSAGITNSKTGVKHNTAVMSGTSMAAPFITSAMAYIKMKNKDLSVQGTYLELKKYCVDLGTKGKDEKYGYGCPKLASLFDTSATYSSMTVTSQLAAPKITSCGNGKKGVAIRWSSVSGADGYYLYRRKNDGANVRIGTFSKYTRSYVDSKGSEGDYMQYYVVAYRKDASILSKSSKSSSVDYIFLKKLSFKKLQALGNSKVKVSVNNKIIWLQKKIEVQYSSSRSFRKKTSRKFYAYYTSNTFKVNRKGTSYFRVRSVFSYGGKTFYSAWSSTKKIKVK